MRKAPRDSRRFGTRIGQHVARHVEKSARDPAVVGASLAEARETNVSRAGAAWSRAFEPWRRSLRGRKGVYALDPSDNCIADESAGMVTLRRERRASPRRLPQVNAVVRRRRRSVVARSPGSRLVFPFEYSVDQHPADLAPVRRQCALVGKLQSDHSN